VLELLVKKMDTINLTEAKLNLESIYSQVLTNYTGAVSLFVGTTRDNFEGKKVKLMKLIKLLLSYQTV